MARENANYTAMNGAKLEYSSSQSGSYTQIYGLKTIPDIGGTPNTIDTTDLDNTEYETNIMGLKPAQQYDFEFTGWAPETSSVTQNITYTAQFDALLARYKIMYNLNGGTTSSDTTPKYSSSITSDLFFFDVTKEGDNFRGWAYKGEAVFDEKGNQLITPTLEERMSITSGVVVQCTTLETDLVLRRE